MRTLFAFVGCGGIEMKSNLQFFAEEETTVDSVEATKLELSEEELNKRIEAESDRKLAKALEKKQKEMESQLAEKVEQAKKDAEEYAKLTKKEQDDKEYTKRLEQLEQREKELNLKQLTNQVESDLKENNLPVDFATSLVALDDNEKIKESVTNIKKAFDDAVNNALKEKLRQDTPVVGGNETKEHDPFLDKINKYK